MRGGEHGTSVLSKKFALFHRNPMIKVEIAPEHGVPLTIVRIARNKKNEAVAASKREGDVYIRFDSVWYAFDIDEHPNVPEAKALAKRNGISLAISNPCFELWLLLHLRECPGMQHRHAIQAALKSLVPDYDKKIDFEVYRDGYDKAVKRAKSLARLAQDVGEPGRNPSTNVHELTEKIIPPRKVARSAKDGGSA